MLAFSTGAGRSDSPALRLGEMSNGVEDGATVTPGRPPTPWATPAAASPLAPQPIPHPAAARMIRAESRSGLGRIRQLTFDGCCPGAWWAPDSSAVHFIDRPGGQLGIYGVAVWPPGSLPQMVDAQVTLEAGGNRYLIYPAGGQSMVKDAETGRQWPLPTGGNPVRLSPDGSRVVWWEAPSGRAQVDGFNRIFAAGIDGEDVRELGGLWGADVIGFLPDNVEALVVGRPMRDQALDVVAAIDTRSGALREIARGAWITEMALAPGGAWVAYLVSLDRAAPEANGIWIAATAPGGPAPRRLDRVGGYRWRDDRHVLVAPMEPGAIGHSVWQVDATGETPDARLIDPAVIPIRIANNDWSVAPDGTMLAFVSELDRNIWLVDLP